MGVLDVAGMELTFFIAAPMMLFFASVSKTHQRFSYC